MDYYVSIDLNKACVDIDGVLCLDPTEHDNDDGLRYREFLLNASPHLVPTKPIRHLVTSRLERWRPETEAWLRRHGIVYEKLSMINLPTAAERRRLGNHAAHKSTAYHTDVEATLFIESELHQAHVIAQTTGKPVLCIADHTTYLLGHNISAPSLAEQMTKRARAVARRLKRAIMGR